MSRWCIFVSAVIRGLLMEKRRIKKALEGKRPPEKRDADEEGKGDMGSAAMTNTTPCAVRAALQLLWPPPPAPYNRGGMSFHTQGRGFSPSQLREFSPPQRPSFSPRPSPSSLRPTSSSPMQTVPALWVLVLVPHAHAHPPRSRDHIIAVRHPGIAPRRHIAMLCHQQGTCSRVRMLDTGEARVGSGSGSVCHSSRRAGAYLKPSGKAGASMDDIPHSKGTTCFRLPTKFSMTWVQMREWSGEELLGVE
ncbi:hypothetical protein BU17DRAFT_65818 [Hysterangium stoloniferum]|nr:hypothetical protein BU17DRAFT_65818 [Hysterangium stoloniferum]